MWWTVAGLVALMATIARAGDLPCTVAVDLQGDIAYGAYLGAECVTCHQSNGTLEGIPVITGWETQQFANAIQAYKCGARDHPVMQMVAARLGPNEIAALAAYFEGLE